MHFVGQEALAYYTSKSSGFAAGDPSLMLVFDIDETVLSNLGALRNKEFGLGGAVASQSQKSSSSATDMAPAIAPMLELYRAAYRYGMSVRVC